MRYLLVCAGITILFSACGIKDLSNTQVDVNEKPNIIFILSDDLSWGDLGINGQSHFSTPNIDRLAKEGLQFSNAYAGSPECAASSYPSVFIRSRLPFLSLPKTCRLRPTITSEARSEIS